MGNSEPTHQKPPINFPHGILDITFEKREVSTGDKIMGRINLTLVKRFPTQKLTVELKGTERTMIMNLKKFKTATPSEVLKNTQKTVFLKSEKVIEASKKGFFEPGAYSFPFDFTLSSEHPCSFTHNCQTKQSSFASKIEYNIEARLDNPASALTLKRRENFLVFSKSRDFPGVNSATVVHDFKSFATFLGRKYIKMQIKTVDDASDCTTDNLVFIDIDATHAQSSPVDLKLQIIREVSVKSRRTKASCKSLLWETLIAKKLDKGFNYTGDTALFVRIPGTVTSSFNETLRTKNTENKYFLKLIFQKANSNFFTNFRDPFFELDFNFYLVRSREITSGQRIENCHQKIPIPQNQVLENQIYERHQSARNNRLAGLPLLPPIQYHTAVRPSVDDMPIVRNGRRNTPVLPVPSNQQRPVSQNLREYRCISPIGPDLMRDSGIPIYDVQLNGNFNYPSLESYTKSENKRPKVGQGNGAF